MSGEELKPCPFCGSPVEIVRKEKIGVLRCAETSPCFGSGLGNFFKLDQEAEAIAAWNSRVDTDPHSEADHWPTCEGCAKPIKPGHFVHLYDEGLEVHIDCDRPYYASNDEKAVIMLGDPMRHFFTTCSECGNDRPNYSGICDDCAPDYADPPFSDDVDPNSREPKEQSA